jgi:LytS/YehU family sensor histidine kinase
MLNALPQASSSARMFWLLHLGGWSGYAAFAYLSALAHGKPADYWWIPTTIAAVGCLVTLGLRYVLRWLLPLPGPKFFLAALPPILLASGIIAVIYAHVLQQWCPDTCRPTSVLGYVAYMGSFVYVVMSWAGLYFGIKTYGSLQQQTQATLKAQSIAHEAQLRMLRYQLNPHFLFNTLNAISTLILDHDSDTANRMVSSLSAFLRHSLDADPHERVTLKQELEALELYLGIEKVRFSDRLKVRVDIAPDAYGALVPNLLLQPLIENAIKYAVSRQVSGGTIEIQAKRHGEDLHLAVLDDGPGFAEDIEGLPAGRGVGLRNTRDRLLVLFGERQSFTFGNRAEREPGAVGAAVRIRLPYESGTLRVRLG